MQDEFYFDGSKYFGGKVRLLARRFHSKNKVQDELPTIYGYNLGHIYNLKHSKNRVQDGFYFMLEPPGKAVTLWLALDKVISIAESQKAQM